jgi:DNA-binding transcriptional ArsR family regulator
MPLSLIHELDGPEELAALTHPLRVRLLSELRTARSAAEAARRIGEPRQKVGYHLHALLDAGLVVAAGERRRGNLVEDLYQARARSFVVSPGLLRGDPQERALADQLPLEHLVELGGRVQRDATTLLDAAAFDGLEVAAAAVTAEVRFPDDATRAAFLDDYLAAVAPLLERHGAPTGASPYRVVLAVYPELEEEAT